MDMNLMALLKGGVKRYRQREEARVSVSVVEEEEEGFDGEDGGDNSVTGGRMKRSRDNVSVFTLEIAPMFPVSLTLKFLHRC